MRISLFLVSCILSAAALQAQPGPALRQLGPIQAQSTETFGAITSVRPLGDGRVLVNEPFRRRVVMLDPALSAVSVIADSTAATVNAYSGRTGGLIPWKGDSTLFVDPVAMSMLMIDPAGKIGRVMSVPRSQDAMSIGSPTLGAAYDGTGHIVYRGSNRMTMPTRGAGGAFTMPEMPDSAPLVRVDLATRQLDTVTFVKIQKITMRTQQDSGGRVTMTSLVNPLPVVDDWAVLTDGSIAVVRGRDYHVDLFHPDGTRESVAKMPFDWQRLSDEDKAAFIDSVKVARQRLQASQPATQQTIVGGPGTAPPPSGGGAGVEQRVMVFSTGPGGAPGGGPPPAMRAPELQFIAPSELPDYKPPFFANSTKADLAGNLWIRTIPTRQVAGGPVYDVVNGQGQLVERVQVPLNATVVGFAPASVFLMIRDGNTSRLARAALR